MRVIKKKIFCINLHKPSDAILLKALTILYVSDDYWIASKGYNLYKYDAHTQKWLYFSKVTDSKNSLLSRLFLTKRLFRAEITQFYRFQKNVLICIAKKGIFKFDPQDNKFKKCFSIEKGSRPMSLCQDNKGVIYFGEYYNNPERNSMHIYKSHDNCENWQIAYTFPQGTINHIHGIYQDRYSDKLWIMTGDLNEECILGYTDNSFNTFIPLFKGSQKYRTCVLLFYEDRIVYATDSQYEQNVIREINRETGEIIDLCKIQGSGIYGGQIGDMAFISTTVEPSNVNKDQNSYLWFSKDGRHWQEVLHFRKDFWPKTYFQFGSIRFPSYHNYKGDWGLMITGRSLKRLDGNSLIIPSLTN